MSSEFPPGPGGIGTHAYQLSRHLARLNWQVLVVAPQDYVSPQEREAFNSSQPFAIHSLSRSGWRMLTAGYRLGEIWKCIRLYSPQAVIFSGEKMVWLAGVLKPFFRMAFLAVGHGTEFGKITGWQARITRWAFHRMDHLIAVSQYTRAKMETLGILSDRITVIPNGADEERFFPLPEKRLSSLRAKFNGNQSPILLTVGNVTDRKGQEVVIRALPKILSRFSDAQYWMVGLPTLRDKLEQVASELKVQDHVHFLGRLGNSELVEAYNACDIFIMASREMPDGDVEGFGIAILEAALCGKPSIGTLGTGTSEAIFHGYTGLLVPQNDPTALASAVISLLENKEYSRQLGQNAYHYVMAHATWEKRVLEYHHLLLQLLPQ
ncbi:MULTISPECIES: glycosyltransferase family 4 protein [Anaerolinea]|uniref:glycosyltransferase family 4 protein n=1 Tax=Anaerolinea TaxID=233189 RepID=UPI00030E0B21|nr:MULTISPECIES: glycosyltransferase family 4 protein [Anaerolinea]